ncbi:hypothetical protein [Bradyrhizobium sp. 188]|uniref:hypothetical protein n=1 Tax=Bradyrhizobium sp. 188 TaxID=2782656 RepID=UPI001FF85DC1|nr:hypothetical protein [Bradyrhizobium sp. 188]MCK1501476.1 hypothetical protein [Bradyrhizobium sp. 188]
MRPAPQSFKLTFLLPGGAAVTPGFHQPAPDGCALDVRWPLVEISGPSRRAVFDHATRLLRLSCRHLPPTAISAQLVTPARPAGRDAWSIIVGADVAFSPTGLDPEFPRPELAQPPPRRLEVIEGGRGS